MAKIQFDQTGERLYETGAKECVLYVYDSNEKAYGTGVAWNGITAVTESPSGAEATALYADDIKYLNLMSAEEFGATIEAYTYPEEFAACNGEAQLVNGVYMGQQSRSTFGFVYKTTVGNDTMGNDYGYKLHVVYGCLASPSEKAYATINDSPEAITFSYEVTTTPVTVGTINGVEYKPTSIITIDSTKCVSEQAKANLATLEGELYGTGAVEDENGTEPTLLMPSDIYRIMSATA